MREKFSSLSQKVFPLKTSTWQTFYLNFSRFFALQNQIIHGTMNGTRIYIFLGAPTALVDMMAQMETLQLFDKGEYMVIYVDMMSYSAE